MPYEPSLTQYITPLDELIVRDVNSPLHGRYYYDNPWCPVLPCLKHIPMSVGARNLANDARKAMVAFSAMVSATTWQEKRDSSIRIFAIVYKWAREKKGLANFRVDEEGNLVYLKWFYLPQPPTVTLQRWLEGTDACEVPFGLQILGIWNLIGATAYADDEDHGFHSRPLGQDAVRYAAEHARHFSAMVRRYLEERGWSFRRIEKCLEVLYADLCRIFVHFDCPSCRETCDYYIHFLDRYLYPWMGRFGTRLPYEYFHISKEYELRHWLSISYLPVAEVAPPAMPRSASSRSSLASLWQGRKHSQPKYGLDNLLDELKLADVSALPASLRLHKKDHQLLEREWVAGGGQAPRGKKFDIRLWQ